MDFIEIVKSYLKNEKLNNEIYDKELVKIAIEQSLETILYPTLSNEAYLSFYISWARKQELFYSLDKEITAILNKNKIPHIYFKGTILSKIYDDPSIRTRGDIDLYVSPNNIDKAKKALLNNGYILDNGENESMHHYAFKKNNIEIELHFKMFDPDCDKSWIDFFENPFELSNEVNDYLYEFKPTYHILYCIMHFAHHLRYGAGIRYMLDFYYMLKKTDIDYNELHKDLKLLGLSKLYNNILNVIYYISNERFDDYKKDDISYFIDYMLKSGIHGFGKENDRSITHAVAHVDKKRYFIVKVFLTDKMYRKSLYPKLGSKAILYPLCLFKHWLFLMTHRFVTLFKFLFGKNKNKDLYKKLGI